MVFEENPIIDDARIIDEIKRPMQPPRWGLQATLDEIKGLYGVAGENHILSPQMASAEKAPMGLGSFPVPIIRRRD